jgi:hypothetical protein
LPNARFSRENGVFEQKYWENAAAFAKQAEPPVHRVPRLLFLGYDPLPQWYRGRRKPNFHTRSCISSTSLRKNSGNVVLPFLKYFNKDLLVVS